MVIQFRWILPPVPVSLETSMGRCRGAQESEKPDLKEGHVVRHISTCFDIEIAESGVYASDPSIQVFLEVSGCVD